jgi:hypothetical protein
MTQKTNSRVVIDTNRHGIRRETNLDTLAKKSEKKKKWQKDPSWKKKEKTHGNKEEANNSREIQQAEKAN